MKRRFTTGMEKAREFDPLGHAGLTPSGIIKMTPVNDTYNRPR